MRQKSTALFSDFSDVSVGDLKDDNYLNFVPRRPSRDPPSGANVLSSFMSKIDKQISEMQVNAEQKAKANHNFAYSRALTNRIRTNDAYSGQRYRENSHERRPSPQQKYQQPEEQKCSFDPQIRPLGHFRASSDFGREKNESRPFDYSEDLAAFKRCLPMLSRITKLYENLRNSGELDSDSKKEWEDHVRNVLRLNEVDRTSRPDECYQREGSRTYRLFETSKDTENNLGRRMGSAKSPNRREASGPGLERARASQEAKEPPSVKEEEIRMKYFGREVEQLRSLLKDPRQHQNQERDVSDLPESVEGFFQREQASNGLHEGFGGNNGSISSRNFERKAPNDFSRSSSASRNAGGSKVSSDGEQQSPIAIAESEFKFHLKRPSCLNTPESSTENSYSMGNGRLKINTSETVRSNPNDSGIKSTPRDEFLETPGSHLQLSIPPPLSVSHEASTKRPAFPEHSADRNPSPNRGNFNRPPKPPSKVSLETKPKEANLGQNPQNANPKCPAEIENEEPGMFLKKQLASSEFLKELDCNDFLSFKTPEENNHSDACLAIESLKTPSFASRNQTDLKGIDSQKNHEDSSGPSKNQLSLVPSLNISSLGPQSSWGNQLQETNNQQNHNEEHERSPYLLQPPRKENGEELRSNEKENATGLLKSVTFGQSEDRLVSETSQKNNEEDLDNFNFFQTFRNELKDIIKTDIRLFSSNSEDCQYFPSESREETLGDHSGTFKQSQKALLAHEIPEDYLEGVSIEKPFPLKRFPESQAHLLVGFFQSISVLQSFSQEPSFIHPPQTPNQISLPSSHPLSSLPESSLRKTIEQEKMDHPSGFEDQKTTSMGQNIPKSPFKNPNNHGSRVEMIETLGSEQKTLSRSFSKSFNISMDLSSASYTVDQIKENLLESLLKWENVREEILSSLLPSIFQFIEGSEESEPLSESLLQVRINEVKFRVSIYMIPLGKLKKRIEQMVSNEEDFEEIEELMEIEKELEEHIEQMRVMRDSVKKIVEGLRATIETNSKAKAQVLIKRGLQAVAEKIEKYSNEKVMSQKGFKSLLDSKRNNFLDIEGSPANEEGAGKALMVEEESEKSPRKAQEMQNSNGRTIDQKTKVPFDHEDVSSFEKNQKERNNSKKLEREETQEDEEEKSKKEFPGSKDKGPFYEEAALGFLDTGSCPSEFSSKRESIARHLHPNGELSMIENRDFSPSSSFTAEGRTLAFLRPEYSLEFDENIKKTFTELLSHFEEGEASQGWQMLKSAEGLFDKIEKCIESPFSENLKLRKMKPCLEALSQSLRALITMVSKEKKASGQEYFENQVKLLGWLKSFLGIVQEIEASPRLVEIQKMLEKFRDH